ncbi:MAG: bifunctional transcriptional activator/DNA repair enzyme AdaA [Deferribacterales bacterium]
MGDYERIEKAIKFIMEHADDQPDLESVARYLDLSPFHFQRLFKDWAGISPKRFLQYLTVEKAKKLLTESRSVLDTAFEAGLSGPSRLHDLFVSTEAVTPGEYKSMGESLSIRHSFQKTPFGECLIAVTDRGVCGLSFTGDRGRDAELTALRDKWKNAVFSENTEEGRDTIEKIFARHGGAREIKVFMKGTNFQIKVWTAVMNIPDGTFASYGRIAKEIGCPGASRAVGTALGQNSVGYLIPCHRVFRETGVISGYRWGADRKRAMIAYEASGRDVLDPEDNNE